jgi:hypothetical protein
MNDILDCSINMVLEGELFKQTKQCSKFFSQVICYITEEVADPAEN